MCGAFFCNYEDGGLKMEHKWIQKQMMKEEARAGDCKWKRNGVGVVALNE